MFVYTKDPCESKPCHNGGLCKVVGNTDFMCVCPQTFKGKHCEGKYSVHVFVCLCMILQSIYCFCVFFCLCVFACVLVSVMCCVLFFCEVFYIFLIKSF